MADHPDHEQLAAFQAGDGDRRQRSEVEAHLDRCPSCAEVVALVEQARQRLALLEEPELPAGLHDRLAAAVDGEVAQPVRVLPRPAPWYRRPAAWGAAAALLLAALVVPLLDRTGGVDTTAAGGGSATPEAALAPSLPGDADLPVIQVTGEVSAAVVRSRLAGDSAAKRALDSAGARSSGGEQAAPPASQDPSSGTQGQGAYGAEGDAAASTSTVVRDQGDTGSRTADAPSLASCLPAATAAAPPGTRPLVPAFYVEGTYKGRPATVLVTTSTAQPDRVDLWVFPRGTCSSPPLATERVR